LIEIHIENRNCFLFFESTSVKMTEQTMLERLTAFSATISTLTALIPPAHYNAAATETPEWQYKSKYHKNTSAQKVLKKKAKQDKLDPDAVADEVIPSNLGMIEGESTATMQELREKLKSRIAKLRGGRTKEDDVPKSRQDLLAARTKKKEKNDKKKTAQKAQKTGEKHEIAAAVVAEEVKLAKRVDAVVKDDAALDFGVLTFGDEKKRKRGPTDAAGQLKKVLCWY
jgi:ATP-dependent protease HslVU (ClpYQ) ATPase subunit